MMCLVKRNDSDARPTGAICYLKWVAALMAIMLGAGVLATAASAQPETPQGGTFVGQIDLVDFLPEDIAAGEDCGGGDIVLTTGPEGSELLSVEVRGFRVVGVPSSLVVSYDPGQVPIDQDGSFSIAGPLAALPTFAGAIQGTFNFSVDPATVAGNLSVSLTDEPIVICETGYSAAFSDAGLAPLATPTPSELPTEAQTFEGTIESAIAIGPTGVDLGPCGGGDVRVTVSGDRTALLRIEVAGFVLFGAPTDRTIDLGPEGVAIDSSDGSFQTQQEQIDPGTGQGSGILEFAEGAFDFSADPPRVSGTLGTRGLVVCEAAFSAHLVEGAALPEEPGLPARLPETGDGQGGSSSSSILWVALAAVALVTALAVGALAARKRDTP